jgi:hypothetical protein
MVFAPYLLQIQDSINAPQQLDTVVSTGAQHPNPNTIADDSVVGYFPSISDDIGRPRATTVAIVPKQETSGNQTASSSRKGTLKEWNTNKNFFTENGLTGIVTGSKSQPHKASSSVYTGAIKPHEIIPQQRYYSTNDWVLGIFLMLVVLFVWIRIFYSKFFATLASALISFHISAKLFQEKNVLQHRVSIVLDFIYLIIFSVFIFELIDYLGYPWSGLSGINLYLLLLNILMLYALFRIFILRLTGLLFLNQPLFSEYIHHTFVINKGMGIALFPVVIMMQYLPYKLIPVVLVLGVLVFAVAFLWKIIRAYQIIIRRDILLFYLILYLCTLEILPLLLGYKFVTSLIQSN